MELTLHPLAKHCRASGRAFAEGDRVVSHLVREETGEIARHDVLAVEDANYAKPAFVFCSWTHPFKARRSEENPERTMKLTAENLFVTLADPTAEPNEENTPMLQFLALMLERKKILKPRGMTPDRARQVYEHAKTHQRYEIPAGVLDEAFFVKIQGQLDLLVGGPKKKAAGATPETAGAAEETASATAGESAANLQSGGEAVTKAESEAPAETSTDERPKVDGASA
ncbi:MAG TPA: hypothetical protein VEA63_02595 [Opitutus sp.]|nr:hypothetical protein [Opitutus sp.]